MRDQLSICNGALDELPSGTIQTIDDPDDVGARACKRRYRPVLEDLLAEHHYDAAIRRTVGAPVTLDRQGEWLYAYEYPSDALNIVRVLPSYAAAYQSTAYVLQPGQYVSTGVGYFPNDAGVRYIVSNGKIYSNLATATIEYVVNDPELALFSPLFGRAFELELAARICMPVLKSRGRQKELIGMAEVARQRAIADDLNNSPHRWDAWPSEESIVRGAGPVYGMPANLGWYPG